MKDPTGLEIAMIDLKDHAEWVGEDGDAVVNTKTKLGALRKFKKLFRRDCGESEASDCSLEKIGIAWLHLPTKEEYVINGWDWYCSIFKKSKYQVFFYRG